MIALGSNEMSKAYVGSTEVSKVYLGSDLVYSKYPIGYYTIDQTGTYSSPSDMVRDREVEGIQIIRDASHLYVCELVNGTLQCKQVKDSDKTKYLDGTAVTYTANNDLFMKLPKFWWKCENLDNNSDKVKISFSLTNQSGWMEWPGNIFIGVYKGYVSSSKLYSRSGVSPTKSTTFNNFKTYASNRGSGYRLVTWEAHNMIALLHYGLIGTLNGKSVFGIGNKTDNTGLCDSLGMTDTTTSTSSQMQEQTNTWGLEAWYLGLEMMDNIMGNGTRGQAKVCNSAGTTIRTITGLNVVSTDLTATKVILGSYGDLAPKANLDSLDKTMYYSSATTCVGKTNNYISRRCFEDFAGCQIVSMAKTQAAASTGTRLQYEGNYEIIT